jgi:hypothetical protein
MDLSVRRVAPFHQQLARLPSLYFSQPQSGSFTGTTLLTAAPCCRQVNTIISRVTGRDRAKFEAKFAKKSKAEDAYHEKKEYVQEL